MISKHSITIRGHRTSFSLEDEFWNELRSIAKHRQIAIAALMTEIDALREEGNNLSSAARVYVLHWLKSQDADNNTDR